MAAPVAIVTGGAGGLGSAICTKLASDGMRVVVGYNRSGDAAHQLVSTLVGAGHSARHAPVTDTASLAALAAAIADDYGGCDVLVESRITKEVRDGLTAKGHQLTLQGDFSSEMGGGQAVMSVGGGVHFGASDPRKDGAAVPENPAFK